MLMRSSLLPIVRSRRAAGSPTWPAAAAALMAVVLAGCLPGEAGAARLVLEPASGPPGSTATLRGSGLRHRAPLSVLVGKRGFQASTSRRGFLRATVRIRDVARRSVPVVVRHGGRRFRLRFDIDGPSTHVTTERVDSQGVRLRYTSGGLTPGTQLELAARGLMPRARGTLAVGGQVVARLNATRRGVVRVSVPAERLRPGRNAVELRIGGRRIRLATEMNADPLIAAAGDIACGDRTAPGAACADGITANLVQQLSPKAVLALGDVQYERGQLGDFLRHYDVTWGRFRDITYPAVGNHEYLDKGPGCGSACGYFDYFNGRDQLDGRAGRRGEGYYAFDVGAWRLYALNSNCGASDSPGCGAGSAQERWLRGDLARNPRRCSLAFMHHPLFTSETRPAADTVAVTPLWQAFYDAGGDVMLVGHSHHYERFAPQDPQERLDPARGIRQFVVGTGGRNMYGFPEAEPNSEIRSSEAFGVLALTLHPTSYDWRFVPQPDRAFTDAGSQPCR
jgi:acid phosphatase type 7